MTPFTGQFVEFSQVYREKAPSILEIKKFFESINSSHLLQLLCKMNIAVWKSETMDTQQSLLNLLFTEKDKKIIIDLLKANSSKKIKTLVFHRHQLLFAIKLALLNPNNKQGRKLDENKNDIGKYLLAISQCLTPPQSTITQGIDEYDFEYARQQISRLQYFHHDSIFVNNIARSLAMWVDLPNSARFKQLLEDDSVSLNIEKEFKDEVGMSIKEFITLGAINTIKLNNLNINTENPYDFMLQFGELWSETNLPKEKQDIIFKYYSQNIGDFQTINKMFIEEMLNGKDIFECNFLPFVYYPIINIENNLSIVVDPQFLEEWITSGVYWILLRKFRGDEKKSGDLSKYFGLLHQEYVYQTLLGLCDEVIEIKRRKGIKTCDFVGVIVAYGKKNLLFFESKKVALGLSVTLAGEKVQTIKNLSKIFGKTGFGQIYSTIKLYERGELQELKHIVPDQVDEIYPILVTDRFIAEESLNRNMYEKEFFNKIVADAKILLPQILARPIFLSSEELEIIEAAKQNHYEFDFLSFLQLRSEQLNDREYRPAKVLYEKIYSKGLGEIVNNLDSVWNNLYLAGYTKYKNERLKKIFFKFMNKTGKILFPKKT